MAKAQNGFTLVEVLVILLVLLIYGLGALYVFHSLRFQLSDQDRQVSSFDAANRFFELWHKLSASEQKQLCQQVQSLRCAWSNMNKCPLGSLNAVNLLGCFFAESEYFGTQVDVQALKNRVCIQLETCQSRLGQMLLESRWNVFWYNTEKNRVENRIFTLRKSF